VKRRETEAPGFLERPAAWWAQRRPYVGDPGVFNQLPAFAGRLLAAMGVLRGDELVRLVRIAAGVEQHRLLTAEAAQAILDCPPEETDG
jgi:hypothetical protein